MAVYFWWHGQLGFFEILETAEKFPQLDLLI
jgi:hypothetical protein